MKPIFNDVRWGELLGWLAGLSGILSSLVMSPIPPSWKVWAEVGIAVIAFFLAFLRNPKSLDWVDEAQAAVVAINAAGVSLPAGVDATGPKDDVEPDVVARVVESVLPPMVAAAAPELAGNIVGELKRVLRRGIRL